MLVRRPVPALLSPVLATGIRDNHWQRYRGRSFCYLATQPAKKNLSWCCCFTHSHSHFCLPSIHPVSDFSTGYVCGDQVSFVTDFYFSLQQKFSNITKTKLVSQAPEHGEQHDVCRKLEIVELCAGSFIEAPCAVPADEGSTAQQGPMFSSWIWT